MNLAELTSQILWIAGSSLIIAAVSWRAWQMRITCSKVSFISDNKILDLGLIIFCLGIVLSTNQPWARYFFILIMVSVTIIAMVNWISSVRKAR